MSMDLSFLSNSYMQQILHRLREAENAGTQRSADRSKGFGDILSAKDNKNAANTSASKTGKYGNYGSTPSESKAEEANGTDGPPVMRTDGTENVAEIARRWAQETQAYYNRKQMADSTSSDLFGERQILNDRGIDWISALGLWGF